MTSLSPAQFCLAKREGREHSRAEIEWFVRGLVSGEVADYQATAWLMAVCLRGLSPRETADLTRAMMESGERYDLSAFGPFVCDKHSTGGVGDKVSLILAPLAAACGLVVPMMSGRALGHTGGTLDKLESMPGFRVGLSRAEFENVLRETRHVMIGQSAAVAPADRKLYALRDVTGTVESIPLITASILSKKLAEGTRGLILDVKFGPGAFMKTRARASELARSLARVARALGLKCEAVLSPMNEPLGYAVGNALEVIECIEIMSGKPWEAAPGAPAPELGPRASSDLVALTLKLCTRMLVVSGKVRDPKRAMALARARLADGSAWERFKRMTALQDGRLDLTLAPGRVPVLAPRAGRVGGRSGLTACADIGWLLIEMRGGRKRASDVIDPGVGMVFHHKVGARVKRGERLATLVVRPDQMEVAAADWAPRLAGMLGLR